ncbi:hypothetical protein Metho_1629 [Methanomethylovorans hollandica DSM 15978]|jgi:hypothetical protein|uniref:Uncharacterized protein n=1 Tax=Methanomethylovorans hollandica (strain DSM 15978 / NBRC 107637 / DMS1) TaxID=867904 RepID=L0L0D8_METHD|nr:hypothetical protein [Methanomethylovorans hollandica]AGB49823.1 hypothetical protein Metho_1629 [Methanomethylovorans hollandica DSM 15978]
MILCECGKFIETDIFKDYMKTSFNPSTRVVGHRNCGLMFNFADGKGPKKYSSRKELRVLACKFAQKNLPVENTAQFLLAVERFKSQGRLRDVEILMNAYHEVLKNA